MMATVPQTLEEYRLSGPTEDDDVLGARLADEGYLFFPGFFDPRKIRNVRQSLTPALFEMGLAGRPDDDPVWTGRSAAYLDDTPLYATTEYSKLFESPEVTRLLERLFGEAPYVFGCPHLSYGSPDSGKYATAAHQDGYLDPEDDDFLTMWIPLMTVERFGGGGLAVAPGTHQDGLRRHDVLDQPSYLGETIKQIGIPIEDVGGAWLTTAYREGDLLMFHCHTVHGALPNSSSLVRLSVDNGAQPASKPRSFYSRTSILHRRALNRIWTGLVHDGDDGTGGLPNGVMPELALGLINKVGLSKEAVISMTREEAFNAWNDYLFST